MVVIKLVVGVAVIAVIACCGGRGDGHSHEKAKG